MPLPTITRRIFGLAVGAGAVTLSTGSAMSKTLSASTGEKPQIVSFPSGDGSVIAHLYLPKGYDAVKRYPAVAIGGSFCSIKEQMGGIYAGELARRGIISLAIDYRNYGQSSGAIRQYEDPDAKAVDLSSALRFLKARSDVSGAGILGVCTSGGTAMYTAAVDPNARAVATVAGFFSDPALQEILQGPGGVVRRLKEGSAAKAQFEKTGVIDTITAYSTTEKTAANFGPMFYYEDKKRGAIPEWRNEFAVMAWAPMIAFDPVSKAPHVTAPTLIVHSDESAFPDKAREVYASLAGPKELYWAKGTHFDFYDQALQVTDAAEHVATFFQRTLA